MHNNAVVIVYHCTNHNGINMQQIPMSIPTLPLPYHLMDMCITPHSLFLFYLIIKRVGVLFSSYLTRQKNKKGTVA